MYLAADPLVWRIGNVAAAGQVLCDALGDEAIGRINAGAAAMFGREAYALLAALGPEPGDPVARLAAMVMALGEREVCGGDGG